MEVRAYVQTFKRYTGLIILIIAIAFGSSVAVVYLRTPQYVTNTTLFLNPSRAEPTLGYENSVSLESLANSYAEFMRTSSFAASVSKISGVPLSQEELNTILASRYIPDTPYLHITITYSDPYIAQRIANAAAQALIIGNTAPIDLLQQTAVAVDAGITQQYNSELINTRREQLSLYDQQLTSLHDQMSKLEAPSATAEEKQKMQDLQEQVRTTQAARIELLQSLVESNSNNQNTQPANRQTAFVVDMAPLPQKPESNRILLVLTATIIGIVIAVGIALLLGYLDTSVRLPETLAAGYGGSVLGVIDQTSAGFSAPSLALGKEPPELDAAFDALQLAVQAVEDGRSQRPSLLITSALGNEGKTFVATNLALSLSRNGKRVILVDADIREPTLQDVFNVARTPGLTDFLSDSCALDDVLQDCGFANLYLLTAGSLVAQPAALFNSQAMTDALHHLASRADVVVIDAPPILGVSDTLALAPHVDGVLQVVRSGKTPMEQVLRAKTALERMHAPIIGSILNAADTAHVQQDAVYSYGKKLSANVFSAWQRLVRWRPSIAQDNDTNRAKTYAVTHDKPILKPSVIIDTRLPGRASKQKGRAVGRKSSKYLSK